MEFIKAFDATDGAIEVEFVSGAVLYIDYEKIQLWHDGTKCRTQDADEEFEHGRIIGSTLVEAVGRSECDHKQGEHIWLADGVRISVDEIHLYVTKKGELIWEVA